MVLVDDKKLAQRFFSYLKNKQESATDFAKSIYTSKQALSDWKRKNSIPDSQKMNVAKALRDPQFYAMLANNQLGLPTVSKDDKLKPETLAYVVHLFNQEKKKYTNKEKFEEVLAHDFHDLQSTDVIVDEVKDLSEEIGLEISIINQLIEDYGITEKELI